MRFSYLDKNILFRLAILILIDILSFGFAFSGANTFLVQNYPLLQIGTMLVFALFVGLTIKELGKFIQGFEGEADVKEILSKLPDKYRRFYDITLSNNGNIDAIVLGPTGVCSVEVKSYSGKIRFENNELKINGYLPKNDFLKQAYAEAAILRKYISEKLGEEINVQPILVFSSRKAGMEFGMRPIKGVYVINAKWLNKLICEKDISLNQDHITRIASILEEKMT